MGVRKAEGQDGVSRTTDCIEGESVERIKELTECANAGEELTEAEWRKILRKTEYANNYAYFKYIKAARMRGGVLPLCGQGLPAVQAQPDTILQGHHIRV